MKTIYKVLAVALTVIVITVGVLIIVNYIDDSEVDAAGTGTIDDPFNGLTGDITVYENNHEFYIYIGSEVNVYATIGEVSGWRITSIHAGYGLVADEERVWGVTVGLPGDRVRINLRYSTAENGYLEDVYPIQTKRVTLNYVSLDENFIFPTSSFSATVNYNIVDLTFTGSDASEVFFDFDDGRGWVTDTTYEYAALGSYVIYCKAVNDYAEIISYRNVEVVNGQFLSVAFDDLSDINGIAGEYIGISIENLLDTDILTVIASVPFEVENNLVYGLFEVPGTYFVTVSVDHVNGLIDQKTIFVFIADDSNSDDSEGGFEIDPFLLFGIAILLIFGGVFALVIAKINCRKK